MRRRKTTEEFIADAKKVHGDRYDYSKVDYINNSTKVIIICPEHGEFEQMPATHLRDSGCQKCGREKTTASARRTTEEFIEQAIQVHGDKYGYSLVDYVNAHTKIKIICSEHGVFEQSPSSHIKGIGCQKCGYKKISLSKTKTQEEFIKEAIQVHGDKYGYSLVDYNGCESKVKIICPEHGVFKQSPSSHLQSHGCQKCAEEKTSVLFKFTTEKFVEQAIQVHGDKYGYSLVDYNGWDGEVKIICQKHGVFKQRAGKHLQSHGCQKCAGYNKTTEEFIEQAIQVHGDKYDYSLVDYTVWDGKIKIICPKHGVFKQNSRHHLNGKGCSICSESHLERKTRIYLKSLNIKHEQEKWFPDCRCKNPLPFDFSIEDEFGNVILLIECQGKQHYKPMLWFMRKKFTSEEAQDNFERIMKTDRIKREWAENNSIPLLEIKYDLTDEGIRNKIDEALKDLYPAKADQDRTQLFQPELDFG